MKKANDRQVGGNHYQTPTGKGQLWDYVTDNHMTFLLGLTLRYVLRHRNKNGIEDLEKARHCLHKQLEKLTPPRSFTSYDEFLDNNALDSCQRSIFANIHQWKLTGDTALLTEALYDLDQYIAKVAELETRLHVKA